MITTAVTLTRDLGELGQETDVEFLVRFWPGTPESHMYGLPENYDPGSDAVTSIISAMAKVEGKTIDLTAFYHANMPEDLHDALCEECAEFAERAAEEKQCRGEDMRDAERDERFNHRLAA